MGEAGHGCGVDDVIITDELERRPARAPNFEDENRALVALAEAMAGAPETVLQRVAEQAMTLTRSESAGISLLEQSADGPVFRWVAAAGAFAHNLHGTMPRDESPCGTVIGRNELLLFNEADRVFPAMKDAEPPIYENLLAPFVVDGKAAGTVWAIKHSPEGRFDSEDARLLRSLARFASAGRQKEQVLRRSESRYRMLFDSIDEGFCTIEVLFDDRGNPVDYIFIEVNRAFEAQTGLGDAAGKRMRELRPDHEEHWFQTYGRIALTGNAERFVSEAAALGRWYNVYAFRVDEPEKRRVAILFEDITARRRADEALRASEERQAFLLALADRVDGLGEAEEVIAATCEALGRHLGVGQCGYGEIDSTDEYIFLEHGWSSGDMPPLTGRVRMEDFGRGLIDAYRAGRTVVVEDIHEDSRAEGGAGYASAGDLRAGIGVPLIKSGRFTAAFYVYQARPRRWTDAEIALVDEVADRTWAAIERARAEAALRASEALFRDFAENSADTLWIADAQDQRLEYLSPAFTRVWGESREAVMRDIGRWIELVHPDHRDEASQAMPRLLAGEAVTAEYRIVRPSDGAVRWIRDTGFPIRGDDGSIRRVAGIAQDVTERHRAEDRQRMLLAELQHRVRNTLSVVRSIARRTAEASESVEELSSHLQGRLAAFSRVQATVTRNPDAGIDLTSLIEDELLVHAARESEALTIEGPDILLKPRAAESLSLAIHELASNAVKYGALCADGGRLAVSWRTEGVDGADTLRLEWQENGVMLGSEPPSRRGFGLELLERALPYELDAETNLQFLPTGLRFTLTMPLQDRLLEA